jgi:hypothetical protein
MNMPAPAERAGLHVAGPSDAAAVLSATGRREPARIRTSWTAADITAMEFAPPRWAVPGVISEGVNLLCGPPKVGKSWMSLALGVDVARGDPAFGAIAVEAGPVLYLALEDTARRLQTRLGKVLGERAAGEALGCSVLLGCSPLSWDWPASSRTDDCQCIASSASPVVGKRGPARTSTDPRRHRGPGADSFLIRSKTRLNQTLHAHARRPRKTLLRDQYERQARHPGSGHPVRADRTHRRWISGQSFRIDQGPPTESAWSDLLVS